MPRWLTTHCPVNDEESAWLESAGAWLVKQFEINVDDVIVILPTPEFFPDIYCGEEGDVEKLLNRVCSYMGVSRDRLSVELFSDEEKEIRDHLPSFESHGRGVAGHYRETSDLIKISVSTAYLRDPMALVAVIAHELGHVLLLADRKIQRDRKDHEFLTDLLTVQLGLGIFTANSAFRFTQWSGGFKQGWRAERLGYLSERMFGYALALFAWNREESKPEWSKYLEGNVKDHFKSALKYLQKTVEPNVSTDRSAGRI
jgi:hypothetical protein